MQVPTSNRSTTTDRPMDMMPERLPEFGVYSSFEVELKRKYTRWRGYLLRPLVSLLAWLGICPDWVSFSGWAVAFILYLLSGFASVPVLGWVLLVYIFLDNLDGALAQVHPSNDFGQIVDNFFDLISLLLILLLVGELELVPSPWLLAFWGAYVLILVGGFIANYNGLNALILRVRILVLVPFLLFALAGAPSSVVTYSLALGLVLQLVSLLSISFALARHRSQGLRIPRVFSPLSHGTRVLGTVALLATVIVLFDYLVTRSVQ
ncbi:MAG TPA: CDP-alcohol phosphatidyltransferase family protein [Acidobacteriota bacterium]|nr:CDP-alcohol phosphatidyltransferase family protein [Acidobacteriota bacterium]